eukprot:scaffold215078_cov31-Tisochrysis_lutea.AAC.2
MAYPQRPATIVKAIVPSNICFPSRRFSYMQNLREMATAASRLSRRKMLQCKYAVLASASVAAAREGARRPQMQISTMGEFHRLSCSWDSYTPR